MNEIDVVVKEAVEEYQCPGCVCGSDITCYEKGASEACKRHAAGTLAMPHIGSIFLGMPKGFNRPGECKTKIHIFRKFEDGWGFDMFNVPVWKHKDAHGNTIVRGLCPRVNVPFLHVFLTDCVADVNCIEITDQLMSEID